MTIDRARVIEAIRRAAREIRALAALRPVDTAGREELLREATELDMLALKLNAMTPAHVMELFA